MSVNTMTEVLTLSNIHHLANEFKIPALDVLLIAANRDGAVSNSNLPRARLKIRPINSVSSNEVWHIILPLDNEQSSFHLENDGLLLSGEPVANLIACENDDVVLTYLRAGGRAMTMNTHARSTCVGCVFCPNIIEDAADGNVDGVTALRELLAWTCADHEWTDLKHVDSITVSTGCFTSAEGAVRHLCDLRVAASDMGFSGRLHILSSEVRSRHDLAQLAKFAAPFNLTLTIECFERRELLLRSSKASLTLDDACQILDDCADLGLIGDFTYVVGLDPKMTTIKGLQRLSKHVTTFPRIQVYQAHNDYMRRFANPDTGELKYFLEVRTEIESYYTQTGLAPKSWENYRPLWYTEFAGKPVEGPRV
jgi:hypothetical protein